MYEKLSSRHWDVIRDHPELHDGIYSSAIAVGEHIATKWVRLYLPRLHLSTKGHDGKSDTDRAQAFFGFCWSFAAWIPAILLPPPISMVLGIVDAAIAGYIAYATHLLAGYSPTGIDSCRGSGAHEFQLPHGANESFFDAAARLNGTATDAFQMCASFVIEWKYGVAIS
jgi:hypothetical protein